MIKPNHEKLQWTLEVLTESEVRAFPLMQGGNRVGDQACFAVRGQLTTAKPIVYVVSRDDGTGNVRVLLMAQVSNLTPRAEGEVRLPQDGAFLVSQAPSSIYVLAVERVLSLQELALCFRLILGEPPPSATTRDSTVTSDSMKE